MRPPSAVTTVRSGSLLLANSAKLRFLSEGIYAGADTAGLCDQERQACSKDCRLLISVQISNEETVPRQTLAKTSTQVTIVNTVEHTISMALQVSAEGR